MQPTRLTLSKLTLSTVWNLHNDIFGRATPNLHAPISASSKAQATKHKVIARELLNELYLSANSEEGVKIQSLMFNRKINQWTNNMECVKKAVRILQACDLATIPDENQSTIEMQCNGLLRTVYIEKT